VSNQRTQPTIPFPGPRPYTEDFAFFFLGRDDDLQKAEVYVTRQRLSVLTAASSCGKTSLLQAGLIPRLRFQRLDGIAAGQAEAVQGFPLLLNQWVGRAGAGGIGNFAQLMVLESHRYLASARAWYDDIAATEEETAEVRAGAAKDAVAIGSALTGLQKIAEDAGFAQLGTDQSSSVLKYIEQPLNSGESDSQELLKQYYALLSKSFGNLVVILDQFEEILNDGRLGREAVQAVEFAYRVASSSVSQMISMREDSRHLLRPLEDGGTLGEKRMLYIEPLDATAVRDIIVQVGSDVSVSVEGNAIARLIGAFTEMGTDADSRKDVNLLGLQVVLKSLFATAAVSKTIDVSALTEYCEELSGLDRALSREELALWLGPHTLGDERAIGIARDARAADYPNETPVRAIIAQVAPLRWIAECLDSTSEMRDTPSTPPQIAARDYSEELVRPMVARMAEWLVTPSGFKRPMTFRELRMIAYRLPADDDDLAGPARERGWSLSTPGNPVGAHLENTFAVALHRLVEVGHILKVRGTEQDASYELVHDQFGKPLQEWAHGFMRSPGASLGALYAVDDFAFEWGRRSTDAPRTRFAESLVSSDAEVPTLRYAKWRGCVVEGVDFSGVQFDECDFSRTLFKDCRFGSKATLDACHLTACLFDGCEFDGAILTRCCLDSAGISATCSFSDCTFRGGSLRFAEIRGAMLRDCRFEGLDDELLPMRNLQIINAALLGTTTFAGCSLDGATIGAEGEEVEFISPENVVIIGSDLKGAEFLALHFGCHSLSVSETVARGAVFIDVTFGGGDSPCETAGARLFDVDLTGAVFRACELRNVVFEGVERVRDGGTGPTKTPCPTLVVRASGDTPSVLDTVAFKQLDMENFTFEDCRIEGGVSFNGAQLSGGTIAATGAVPGAELLGGDLSFEDNCDLTAVEFSRLDFSSSKLSISECLAPSVYFGGVNFPKADKGEWRAEFDRCVMPGALFQGSHVHSVRVSGPVPDAAGVFEHAKAATLIVRGATAPELSARSNAAADYTFGDCTLEGLDLENFTFENIVVDGPLTFERCLLSGGTIGGVDENDEDDEASHMRVSADMTFSENCDLSAVELSGVTFDKGAHFKVTDSCCDGMLIQQVKADADAESSLVIERTSLAGAVILDSQLDGVDIIGACEGELTKGWGLTVRRTHGEASMCLGHTTFSSMTLDGLVLQDVEVTGPIDFKRCSVLRCLLSGLTTEAGSSARVNLKDSDVHFAQIDESLCGESSADCIVVLDEDQWQAANRASIGREDLRLQSKRSD